MYRMMIVDDLPIIVDRIARLIGEQKQLNLELYKAYSGNEAINLAAQLGMDIVLTDIKMPGMDGMELFREIRRLRPACRVIFLTSYDEFHYAKEAISGGGFDFLLKFESDESIVKSVERAVSAIAGEQETLELLDEARNRKRQVLPLMQEQCLNNLLYGKSPADPSAMSVQFRDTDIRLHVAMPVFILIGRADEWGEHGTAASGRSLMLQSVKNLTTELLGSSVELVSVAFEEAKIVWLLQPGECREAAQFEQVPQSLWVRTFEFIHKSLAAIQSACRELYRLRISFVLGQTPVEWSRLPESFDYLRFLFLHHAAAGTETRLSDREIAAMSGSNAETVKHKMQSFKIKNIELLGRYLASGAKDEFDRVYEDMMSRTAVEGVSGFLKLEVYHSLASVFLSYLHLHPLYNSLFEEVELEKLMRVNPDLSWNEIKDYFARLAQQIFEHQEEASEPGKEHIVIWLNDYIERHIDGDLSLTRLADAVHLNPVYLSRLYVHSTGVGISEYVNMCRLHKAKELLKNTRGKIYEIAGQVGYDSALSFIRFFKKQTNMTPQEYRDQ